MGYVLNLNPKDANTIRCALLKAWRADSEFRAQLIVTGYPSTHPVVEAFNEQIQEYSRLHDLIVEV